MKPLQNLLIAVVLAGLPAMACAQSATGGGGLTVQQGLSIGTVSPMRLQPSTGDAGLSVRGSNAADAPAMIQITGDPGRVYRIRLPQAAGDESMAVVQDLRIWSATSGDISETRTARLDMNGHDLLRVSGELRVRLDDEGEPVAALPLSIDYE